MQAFAVDLGLLADLQEGAEHVERDRAGEDPGDDARLVPRVGGALRRELPAHPQRHQAEGQAAAPGERQQDAALDLPVGATDSPQEAVDGADVVLVSTPSRVPAVEASWLAPGAHVSSIGTSRLELADDVFLRAELVVTTSKVQEMSPHEVRDDWPWVRLDRDGSLPWIDVAELGDVVTGRVSRPDGITVLHEANGGFGDVAMASWLHERALELGRGTEWEIA